jgi:predicted PhzF superfamily epimerase YddE/YHI9
MFSFPMEQTWHQDVWGTGPFAGNEATVCLLPGDTGEWFKAQVASWKEYGKGKAKR